MSTRTLSAIGYVVVALHLALSVVNQWLIFDQLRIRTPDALQGSLVTAFLTYSASAMAAELMALVACVLIVAGLRNAGHGDGSTHRMVSTILIAYVPIALYSLMVAAALVVGWEPNVWVLSSRTATPDEVAATIREALPAILEPLSTLRHVANGAAALLSVLLLRRMCSVTLGRSIVAAVVFGTVMTLARAIA